MRNIEPPVTVKENGRLHDELTTHPAFGQITASRVSGESYLYGSDFRHNHYVTISISKCESHRSLSRDWQHPCAELIEVALSEAQWATFVSSMNIGSGIACALQRHGGKMVPGLLKPEAIDQKFSDGLSRTMQDIQGDLAILISEVGELGLGKGFKQLS